MKLSDVLAQHAKTAQNILDRVVNTEQKKREAIEAGYYSDMIERQPLHETAFFYLNQYAVLHVGKASVQHVMRVLGDLDTETTDDEIELLLEEKFLTNVDHQRFQPAFEECEYQWLQTLTYIATVKIYNPVVFQGRIYGTMFYFDDNNYPSIVNPDYPLSGKITYGPGGSGNDWAGLELTTEQTLTLENGPAQLSLINDSRGITTEFRLENTK